MDHQSVNQELITFLNESPCGFWAVHNMCTLLERQGFIKLTEGGDWKLESGRNYYVTRGNSALIAFRMPAQPGFKGFQIIASHCDSPHLKVKPGKSIETAGGYRKLNVEKYGGMIFSVWLDRPLSIAGRAVIRTENGLKTQLFKIDRDLLVIPNVAIHMNRQINEGYKYNPQTDLQPLLGDLSAPESILEVIANHLGISAEDVVDADISVFSRTPAAPLGVNEEFIGSGRLDDLQCGFASLRGLLDSTPSGSIAMHCVYDTEEVGSGSRQGAGSTFLQDTLECICEAEGMTKAQKVGTLSRSFMISADNSHSIHPNHPEKADPVNYPVMNGGPVIKYSSDQKYMTDAVSGALFRRVCEKAGVPYQIFTNRADIPGGSTLGKLSVLKVPVRIVDVGLAQLSMHSAYETAGAKDTAYFAEAAKVFYSMTVSEEEDGSIAMEF